MHTVKVFKPTFIGLGKPFFLILSGGVFLCSLLLFSCSESSSYSSRLNHFYELLDRDAISAFEQGDIDKVADYLKQQQADPEFKEKYQALKVREAINLFNDQQTVEFFYHYFYKKGP